MNSDVVVIGGGSIGVCCAYYLARSGRTVALLERDEIGRGCSYANACLITPSHAVPLPAPGVVAQALRWMLKEDSPLLIRPRLDFGLFRWMLEFARNCSVERMERGIPTLRDLCRASLSLFEELVCQEGLQFHFERRGTLYVNSSEAGFEKTQKTAALLAQHGFPSRILSGKEAQVLEPALAGNLCGAAYYPEDAHGDSYLFVSGLAGRLPGLGVTVHEQTSVTGLEAGETEVKVESSRGQLLCKHLVIAAGSWLPELTRTLGVRIPIQPGKGYSVTVPKPDPAPSIPITHQEKKVVVTPIGPWLRFAGTMEFAGMDLHMNDLRADAALRGGRAVLNSPVETKEAQRWCGLRPCTPDGIPIIDSVPGHPNVYLACGHGMLGFTLGPITGKLMSERISGTTPSLPTDALSLRRFG